SCLVTGREIARSRARIYIKIEIQGTMSAGEKPMPQFQPRVALALVMFVLFALAGCGGDDNVRASRGSETESSSSDMNSEATDDRGLVGISADEQAQFLDPNNPLSTRVFYF